MKCYGCGIEKNPAADEVYPWPEDDKLATDPIPPLLVLDCQGETDCDDYRAAVVCHGCFRKLDPDMWIGESCWIRINPKIPFAQLPQFDSPSLTTYPDLVKG